MRDLTEENLTQAVHKSLANCENARLLEIMTSLTKHLHDFVRDVELTPEEWLAGIQFLTETGKKCDDNRQEFILLSDTLGVSMLVDAIDNRKPSGATETSVLGPFYTEGAPEVNSGADLAPGEDPGVVFKGTVKNLAGEPIVGAILDVWQTDPNGLYHMQDDNQEEHHLCGKVRTDDKGNYSFRSLKPVSYSVPQDGPVGAMLRATGRHSYRPAHVHFILSAPGYKTVVTQLFSEGDEYLETDVVYGVKNSLVIDYTESDGSLSVDYDFVLVPNS